MEKSFEEFVEEFRERLLKATGFGEGQIYYKKKDEFPPTAGDRLLVRRAESAGVAEVCALYVRDLYEECQNGRSMEVLIREVMRRLENLSRADLLEKARDLDDYDTIRKQLFIRLINKDKNEEELKECVFRTIGDIALVLYAGMGDVDGCTASMKVKQYMLRNWGKKADQVFEEALKNTGELSPPRIYCWEKLLLDSNYEGDNFMDVLTDYPIRRDAMGNCLSTTRRTNGAVAIFLPGVAERIARLMRGSFYMVFTSIHEVMIHNARFSDPEDLRCVLEDTVRYTTPKEDFLTYHIYYYDKETGTFSCCGDSKKE